MQRVTCREGELPPSPPDLKSTSDTKERLLSFARGEATFCCIAVGDEHLYFDYLHKLESLSLNHSNDSHFSNDDSPPKTEGGGKSVCFGELTHVLLWCGY